METPEHYLEYVKWLRSLVEADLFHPEFLTMPDDRAKELVWRGQVGFLSGGYWTIDDLCTDLQKAGLPEQNWTMIPGFSLTDDYPRRVRLEARGERFNHIVTSATSEAAEAAMRYMDWVSSSQDNFVTVARGIRGTHWDYDASGTVTKYFPGGIFTEGETSERSYTGIFNPNAGINQYQTAFMNPDVFCDPQRMEALYKPESEGGFPVAHSVDRFLPYQFTESGPYLRDMNAIRNTFFNTAIFEGYEDIDAEWNRMVDEWRSAGGETYIRERNEQWNEMKGLLGY